MDSLFSSSEDIKFLFFLCCAVALFNIKNIYANFILRRALEKGKELPVRLADFPVFPTSLDKYSATQKKIDDFIDCVLDNAGKNIELILSSSDLNHIYLRGESINKYRWNTDFYMGSINPIISRYDNHFLYLEIQEKGILIKHISYPFFLVEIQFIQKQDIGNLLKKKEK